MKKKTMGSTTAVVETSKGYSGSSRKEKSNTNSVMQIGILTSTVQPPATAENDIGSIKFQIKSALGEINKKISKSPVGRIIKADPITCDIEEYSRKETGQQTWIEQGATRLHVYVRIFYVSSSNPVPGQEVSFTLCNSPPGASTRKGEGVEFSGDGPSCPVEQVRSLYKELDHSTTKVISMRILHLPDTTPHHYLRCIAVFKLSRMEPNANAKQERWVGEKGDRKALISSRIAAWEEGKVGGESPSMTAYKLGQRGPEGTNLGGLEPQFSVMIDASTEHVPGKRFGFEFVPNYNSHFQLMDHTQCQLGLHGIWLK